MTKKQKQKLAKIIEDVKAEINDHFTRKDGNGGWPLDFLLYKSDIIHRLFPGLEGAILHEFLGRNKNKHFRLAFMVKGKKGARDLDAALVKNKSKGKGKKSGK